MSCQTYAEVKRVFHLKIGDQAIVTNRSFDSSQQIRSP